MKYLVEDTYNGFRLTMLDRHGNARHHYDEEGGHGPVEKLYALAAQTWNQLRSESSPAKIAQFSQYVDSVVAWLDGELPTLVATIDYPLLSEVDRVRGLTTAAERIAARGTVGHART